MPFRPVTTRSLRWRSLEGPGLEHFAWRLRDDRIEARGAVIGNRGGTPYGVFYRLRLRRDWTVETAAIETAEGTRLDLASDGNGRWRDNGGATLPQFDGCIDIDIAATPFTNTLPIRRLALRPADPPVSLNMVYVALPDLRPATDGQIYQCLDADRLYRYEAADRSFAADIEVDEDGLVVNYPSLFERVTLH